MASFLKLQLVLQIGKDALPLHRAALTAIRHFVKNESPGPIAQWRELLVCHGITNRNCVNFTSFCRLLHSYHWQYFNRVPVLRTRQVVGADVDSMDGWYRPLLHVPKAKLCSFMDLKKDEVNCVLEYCDVPSLVKVCYVTSKKFKEFVLINLKHRSGVFAAMALANPDLSLIQG